MPLYTVFVGKYRFDHVKAKDNSQARSIGINKWKAKTGLHMYWNVSIHAIKE